MRAKTIIVISFLAFLLAIGSIIAVILFSRGLGIPSRDFDSGMVYQPDPDLFPPNLACPTDVIYPVNGKIEGKENILYYTYVNGEKKYIDLNTYGKFFINCPNKIHVSYPRNGK